MIIKKCMKCGAVVEVLHDCTCENCGIKCCGETMKTFIPNTEEASFEKHMPVYEVVGDEIVVTVPHVMEEEHFIEWIALVDGNSIQKEILVIGKDAKAKFPYKNGSMVYSYCNKHGLWSVEVK